MNYILAVCVFGERKTKTRGCDQESQEAIRIRDREKLAARDESSTRSQWRRRLIPVLNMIERDGTRNPRHGGYGGNRFWCKWKPCELMTTSDRRERKTGQRTIGEADTTPTMIVNKSSRKLNARAKRWA